MSKREFKDYLLISLKGIAMGAADVVPGVSGGTIAFITGIYEELVTSISNVDFGLIKVWKQKGFFAMWNQLNGNFLLALLFGIALSVFSLMKLMSFLLDTNPVLVWSFFFGLVLASVWYIAKQIHSWKIIHFIGFFCSTLFAYLLTTLSPSGESQSLVYLFICGGLASCAMILPGISGAFILVLLGAYRQIVEAVSSFQIKEFVVVALGAIVGIISFSRVLKWLFKSYEYIVLSILTGFVFGSLNKIWPWKNNISTQIIHGKEVILQQKSVLPNDYIGEPHLSIAIIMASIGFGLIFGIEKWSVKHK